MKNILVIGAGRFGSFATIKLHDLGHQIMVIDQDEARINRLMPYASDARIGDSTDESFMKTLGIPSYDLCIVSIGDDFLSSLQTTFTVKELGAKKEDIPYMAKNTKRGPDGKVGAFVKLDTEDVEAILRIADR